MSCRVAPKLSLQKVVTVGRCQVQPLYDQVLGLVPLPVLIGVGAEQQQPGNDHAGRAAVSFSFDHALAQVPIFGQHVDSHSRVGSGQEPPG
jgi:hypothetical protein